MEFYLAILLLFAVTAFVVHHFKAKRLKQIQKQGVTNISHLKALISLIQIHRGLSSAWLNGDQSKKLLLLNIDKKIHEQVSYLQNKTGIHCYERWTSFVDHWGRLTQYNSESDVDNNFEQHTRLVANLLYLLEDEAERSYLTANSLPSFKNVALVWRELVVTAETIGQSRAIGVGVATSKFCSSVDRIRLSFLLQKIHQTMDETLPNLSVIENFEHKQLDLLNLANSKMEVLISTIEKKLLRNDNLSINHDEYFSLATESIEALDKIFDYQIMQIQKIIE